MVSKGPIVVGDKKFSVRDQLIGWLITCSHVTNLKII